MTAPAFPRESDAARLRRMAATTIRRLCVVPEPLTVTEWAAKYRELPETSTSPGPYDPDVVPYARRWQDLLSDPDTSIVALCWASQLGKSTVLENGIGYRIHRTPAPMVVVQPKIDAAESWAKERFKPMVLATPVLRERVRLGRSSDSTMRYIRFPGGFLFVASAQSATELASRSSPFVLCDETDRYEVIPGEGNPVEIAARRQAAADVGLLALTSTPRDAETTIIWPYLEAGTFELYHVPCPHCHTLQPLVWHGLRWDKGRPDSAAYLCGYGLPDLPDGSKAGCGVLIDERFKRDMLREKGHGGEAEWVATNPEGEYPSSHLNALYSPFGKSGWASLAREWERAHGKPADLQVFVNTRLAECWQETADVVKADTLAERLEPMEEGVVPAGVARLTAGADVQQAGRIEVYVWGWGAGLESWLVAKYVLPGDPQKEPDGPGTIWSKLDEVFATTFPREDGGEPMRIERMFVDSGFAATQVYRYTRRRKGLGIFASKGVGGAGIPILGKPKPQGKERTILYGVGVDAAKTEFLRSQLLERVPGPGYVHLPTWLGSDELAQFVAEKRRRRVNRGQVVYEWVPVSDGAPNEALDCRVYARAALESFGPKAIAKLGTLALSRGKAADPPGDGEPGEGEAPRKRRAAKPAGGGFVNRWKMGR